jgi:hypothetical protein
MYLALKKTHASDATPLQKVISNLIKWRLCSNYSHGGIVIGDTLYHSSYMNKGLYSEKFDMSNSPGWDFFYLGNEKDEEVIKLYNKLKGTPYDLLGLLTFIVSFQADYEKLYCFEWCGMAMGIKINNRVTPEDLLILASKYLIGVKDVTRTSCTTD